MNSAVLIARLFLVGVFALAGASKIADLGASADTVEAFGLPRRIARPLGISLPFAELAVAAALLPSASARWAAFAAVLLLVVFSVGVTTALRDGRAPDCNCFGQVASAPISQLTLVRNACFAAVAIFAAIGAPGSALTSWTTSASAANLVAAFATLLAGIAAVSAYGLSRRAGTITTESIDRQALPPGAPAPEFELASLSGGAVSLKQLLARDRPIVLIFASPTCGPCLQLLPELSRWHGAISDELTMVVIESGVSDGVVPPDQTAALSGLLTLTEPARELAERYFVPGTPSAISISSDGLVSSPPMPGRERIELLIRRVLSTGGTVPGADELIDAGVTG